jgi:ubiquinone/menaquinone biosynthesis C-methylase UbiE
MPDIYDPLYVQQLFDEMAASYEQVNYLTSFGFSWRWRVQCVGQCGLKPGMVVYDLMTGMGECWPIILKQLSPEGHLKAVEFSRGMLAGAARRRSRYPSFNIMLLHQNILENELPGDSADSLMVAFGLKTLSPEQQQKLALEIKRILKPAGTFSLIEVSVPQNKLLGLVYMFYLKWIIPLIGRAFLGNPENYRMLGVYTERFANCGKTLEIFRETGLEVRYHEYFWGCATGISGYK